MTVNLHRRIAPRLSVVRLVDGKSSARRPRYTGLRVNLIWWALEITL